MWNGESSGEEAANSLPIASGVLVDARNNSTSSGVAQPPCPSCGRPLGGRTADSKSWQETMAEQLNSGCEAEPGSANACVAAWSHTTESGRLETSEVVTGHSWHRSLNVGIQKSAVGAEGGGSSEVHVLVLERALMDGHVSRRSKVYAIYLIPAERFQETFAHINRNERVCYHSSFLELKHPIVSERRYSVRIVNALSIDARLSQGRKFQITSGSKLSTQLHKIIRKSQDRVKTANMELQVLCTGLTKEWCEDSVCLTLSTGEFQRVVLTFSIWAYCSDNQWLTRASPVDCMPQEDIEALRMCHITLMEKIHNVSKAIEYLFGLKILDECDLQEISSIRSREGQVAELLRRLKFRGDVLEIFVDILCATGNEGAARILHQNRCEVP